MQRIANALAVGLVYFGLIYLVSLAVLGIGTLLYVASRL
jgi:hypothetical protein